MHRGPPPIESECSMPPRRRAALARARRPMQATTPSHTAVGWIERQIEARRRTPSARVAILTTASADESRSARRAVRALDTRLRGGVGRSGPGRRASHGPQGRGDGGGPAPAGGGGRTRARGRRPKAPSPRAAGRRPVSRRSLRPPYAERCKRPPMDVGSGTASQATFWDRGGGARSFPGRWRPSKISQIPPRAVTSAGTGALLSRQGAPDKGIPAVRRVRKTRGLG